MAISSTETFGGIPVTELRVKAKDFGNLKKLANLFPQFDADALSRLEVLQRILLYGRAAILAGNDSCCTTVFDSITQGSLHNTEDNKVLIATAKRAVDRCNKQWLKNFDNSRHIITNTKFLSEYGFAELQKEHEWLKKPKTFLATPLLFPVDIAYLVSQAAFQSKRTKGCLLLDPPKPRSSKPSSSSNTAVVFDDDPAALIKLFEKSVTKQIKTSSAQIKAHTARIERSSSTSRIGASYSPIQTKESVILRSLKDVPFVLPFFKHFKGVTSQSSSSEVQLTKSYAFYSFSKLANYPLVIPDHLKSESESESESSESESESEGEFEAENQVGQSKNDFTSLVDNCLKNFKKQFDIFMREKISVDCLGDSRRSQNAEYALRSLFETVDLLCNISLLDHKMAYVDSANDLLMCYGEYRPSKEKLKTGGDKVLFYEEQFKNCHEMIAKARELHGNNYDKEWQVKAKAVFKGKGHYEKFCDKPLFFSAIRIYAKTQRKSSDENKTG